MFVSGYVYVYYMYADTHRAQKSARDHLELELEAFVSHLIEVLAIEPSSSGNVVSSLNC